MTPGSIYKYVLKITDVQEVKIPIGARVLSAINQAEQIVVYAAVNPEAQAVSHRFYIVGTGNPVPELLASYMFVGTVSTAGGFLIWHVFDGGEVKP